MRIKSDLLMLYIIQLQRRDNKLKKMRLRQKKKRKKEKKILINIIK